MRNRLGKPDRAAFGKRLNALLDQRSDVPKLADGRGKWAADRYRVKPPSAHAWLHGQSIPDAPRLRMIAVDLGVSSDYLLFGVADSASSTGGEPQRRESRPVGSGALRMALQTAYKILGEGGVKAIPEQYAAFVEALAEECASGRDEAEVLQFARRVASVIAAGGNDAPENGRG
jgi:hypothetical protein